MTKAYELRKAGHFDKAITAYLREIAINPSDVGLIRELAKSYLGARRYADAIPLLWQVHADEKSKIDDHPGQQLQIACAHWCLDDRPKAIELVHDLCSGILNRSIRMAPDLAGGATYGLILHYMAISNNDQSSLNYALKYLKKLNNKYDKRPEKIQTPQQSVRQILGNASFEGVLEEATFDVWDKRPRVRDLNKAMILAKRDISVRIALSVALFHDGVYHRVRGNEAECMSRMREVFDLGFNGETVRWYLARHEVDKAFARMTNSKPPNLLSKLFKKLTQF